MGNVSTDGASVSDLRVTDAASRLSHQRIGSAKVWR